MNRLSAPPVTLIILLITLAGCISPPDNDKPPGRQAAGSQQADAAPSDPGEIIADQPKTIALFLPLSGNLAVYGQAIRDGIISARFQSKSSRPVRVHVFDSAKLSIQQLLDRASHAGVEMAIGPLERQKVDTLLAQTNLPFPVLALNRGHTATGHRQVYQFGLAPEDEMVQVAQRLFADGKRYLLALYPASDWGDRNYAAFAERWKSLGGNMLDSVRYADQKDYSEPVKSLLHVDQSLSRAKDLQGIIGRKFAFTPRRRQDVDAVFLLGNQAQARKINPTLIYYYAEDIPVYATSHIYESGNSSIDAIDLNGILFCDIPWKVSVDEAIVTEIKAGWQDASSAMAPFYALGVDAFRLLPRLPLMYAEDKFHGVTGTLEITHNKIIRRSLLWAKVVQGKAVLEDMLDPSADDI